MGYDILLMLHIRIVRTTGTLWSNPGDVLGRVFDITGLAVYAVLRVDLEALFAFCSFNNFVHPSRAVALRRFIPLRQVNAQRNGSVFQLQVARLVFGVVYVTDKHRVQFGEGNLTIRLRIVDFRAFSRWLQGGVVWSGVVQGERHRHNVLVDVVKRTTQESTELVHRRAEVAAAVQFLPGP